MHILLPSSSADNAVHIAITIQRKSCKSQLNGKLKKGKHYRYARHLKSRLSVAAETPAARCRSRWNSRSRREWERAPDLRLTGTRLGAKEAAERWRDANPTRPLPRCCRHSEKYQRKD